MKAKLTLGPILFHWPAELKRDFYFKIANETNIHTVYLGEIVCSKRAPFFEKYYGEVTERLINAGKNIVYSTFSDVMTKRERQIVKDFASFADEGQMVEVNNAATLSHLANKPHYIGSLFNTYNSQTMLYLAKQGAKHFTLPTELPKSAIQELAKTAKNNNLTTEIQVYGRIGLALSARCYHARAHKRTKDGCQFVCEEDLDGMSLSTLDHNKFLTINGVQTMSSTCLNLVQELFEMQSYGVTNFRISPHSQDMIEVIDSFDQVLNGTISVDEGLSLLKRTQFGERFSNGFYHQQAGHSWCHK